MSRGVAVIAVSTQSVAALAVLSAVAEHTQAVAGKGKRRVLRLQKLIC